MTIPAAHQVSDSTDWLSTSLPAFSALDSALRCQVCKDFYDTPMITSCSHTFCSLCIRRCLSNDGKCPACRALDQASKLKRNWTVEEVVDAFRSNRQSALELAQKCAEEGSQEHPKGKKRKAVGEEPSSSQSVRRSTRPRRQPPTYGQHGSTATEPIVMDSEDSDGEYFALQPKSPPADGLVPCPLCSKRMKEAAVFSHLDKCPGPDAEPELMKKVADSFSNTFVTSNRSTLASSVPAVVRLPQLNYSLLKENALRKKLQELGIPAWGPKPLLERRHREWIDLFNSNGDSTRPKSLRDLLKELDTWERSQGGNAPGTNGLVNNMQHAQVMRKDFDTQEWSGKHQDQFQDLIAQARAKNKAKQSTPKPPENGHEILETGIEIVPPGEALGNAYSKNSTFETSPDSLLLSTVHQEESVQFHVPPSEPSRMADSSVNWQPSTFGFTTNGTSRGSMAEDFANSEPLRRPASSITPTQSGAKIDEPHSTAMTKPPMF